MIFTQVFNWTDLSDKILSTYAISKTKAEKIAWDFFRAQEWDHHIELVAINPGGISGPSLTHNLGIASILKENGYNKVSTKKAPLFLLRFISLFDPKIKALLTNVGKHLTADNSDTKATFGWESMPFKKSALDMAKSVEYALSQNK